MFVYQLCDAWINQDKTDIWAREATNPADCELVLMRDPFKAQLISSSYYLRPANNRAPANNRIKCWGIN